MCHMNPHELMIQLQQNKAQQNDVNISWDILYPAHYLLYGNYVTDDHSSGALFTNIVWL